MCVYYIYIEREYVCVGVLKEQIHRLSLLSNTAIQKIQIHSGINNSSLRSRTSSDDEFCVDFSENLWQFSYSSQKGWGIRCGPATMPGAFSMVSNRSLRCWQMKLVFPMPALTLHTARLSISPWSSECYLLKVKPSSAAG